MHDELNFEVFSLLVTAICEVSPCSATTRKMVELEGLLLSPAWFTLLSIWFDAKAISSFESLTSSCANAHFFDHNDTNASGVSVDSPWVTVGSPNIAGFATWNMEETGGFGKYAHVGLDECIQPESVANEPRHDVAIQLHSDGMSLFHWSP